MYNLFCYYAVLSSVLFLVSWLYYFFCFYFLSTLLLNAGSFTLFLNYRTQNNRIIKGGRKKNNIYLFLSRIQTLFLNTGYRKKKKKSSLDVYLETLFRKWTTLKLCCLPVLCMNIPWPSMNAREKQEGMKYCNLYPINKY